MELRRRNSKVDLRKIGVALKGTSVLDGMERTMRIREHLDWVKFVAQFHRPLCTQRSSLSIRIKSSYMQLFNICTKNDYEKNGEQKTKWYKVGIMKIADSGKKYIKLFHQPNIELFVFDKEESQQIVEPGN